MGQCSVDSLWSLLRQGPFRYLWAGQIVSQVGDSLNKIALLWFVYQLTGSALDMTLVGTLQSVPPLLMSPVTGAYVDRVSKRGLLVSLDLARVVTVTLIPLLYYCNLLSLSGLYLLVLATAVLSAAFGPTMAALIPQLVEPAHLTRANSLIHGAATSGVLVGPALGGILATFMGAQNVLYIDAVTFLVSAGSLALMRVPERAQGCAERQSHSVWDELKGGIRFMMYGDPAIRMLVLASAAFAGGMAAFPLLLPVFAKVGLHVGSAWLGWLWSSLGAGMVSVTAALAWTEHRPERARLAIMVIGIGCAALGMLGLTWVARPWDALVLIALVGAGVGVFTPLLWTLLQERTPQPLRGRVFTLTGASDMACATMTMSLMGWLAGAVGPYASLRLDSAVLFVVALLLVYLRYRWAHAASDKAGGDQGGARSSTYADTARVHW